jgi:hypothetical protein
MRNLVPAGRCMRGMLDSPKAAAPAQQTLIEGFSGQLIHALGQSIRPPNGATKGSAEEISFVAPKPNRIRAFCRSSFQLRWKQIAFMAVAIETWLTLIGSHP